MGPNGDDTHAPLHVHGGGPTALPTTGGEGGSRLAIPRTAR
jgi:hypothetical protein